MIFTYCALCMCIAIVLISTFVRNVLDRRARAHESARVWRDYVNREYPMVQEIHARPAPGDVFARDESPFDRSVRLAQIKALDEWMDANKAPNLGIGENFIVRNDQ